MTERFDIFVFLRTLETLPCLWHKADPLYKDRVKKDAAEAHFIKFFNFTNATELRKKIRSIRNTYNQEIAKIKKSKSTGSGTDSIHIPKLAWFKEAHRFLSKNIGDTGQLHFSK
ncbi:uncharacterized protein LOC135838186 [Planococcus citri]|uniref:uncharacterized protein LOC135838186 n=1 Tax=Planococcus citri TaxID=170843 RepID=UPI0031F9199E